MRITRGIVVVISDTSLTVRASSQPAVTGNNLDEATNAPSNISTEAMRHAGGILPEIGVLLLKGCEPPTPLFGR